MSNINELKEQLNTKTLHLVLLTMATMGIYPIIWLFMNTPKIEKITSSKIADNTFLIWIAVCIGLGGNFLNQGDVFSSIIGAILSIAAWVLYIVWSFRAKSAIQEYALTEHKVDFKMNGFYTFIFTVNYINYCINDLSEAQRKQNILTGKEVVAES